MFAKMAIAPRELLVLRAPRSIVAGQMHDLAIDPIVDLFPAQARIIDTLPRRYHLPDPDAGRWPAKVPASRSGIVRALLDEFAIDRRHADYLSDLIRRLRSTYDSQVVGYHDLFDRARPAAVLLVQNGIEKALFHVAKARGVPTVEVQHGLIGHGHIGYSYPRGVDYGKQTGFPDLFLTFSDFWQKSVFYPAKRHEVVGTDYFASDFGSIRKPRGKIMVISADIYHDDLMKVVREVAAQLPKRQFIYKLHPNQNSDEADIRAAFADMPNIDVGSGLTPASRMMDDVSHLFTIQSTVVYEALQNGRRICILPRHDYNIHSDIFDLPEVSVLNTVSEIAAALEIPCVDTVRYRFFEPFDPARAQGLLADLLDPPREPARA